MKIVLIFKKLQEGEKIMSRSIRNKIIALSISGTTILTGLPVTSFAEEANILPIVNEENTDRQQEGETSEILEQQESEETLPEAEEQEENGEQVDQNTDVLEEENSVTEPETIEEEENNVTEPETIEEEEQPSIEQEEVSDSASEKIEVPEISIDFEPAEYSLENCIAQSGVRVSARRLFRLNRTDYTNFKSQIESDPNALAAYNKMVEVWVNADTITGEKIKIIEATEKLDDYLTHANGVRTGQDEEKIDQYLTEMSYSAVKALGAFLADYPEVAWLDIPRISMSGSVPALSYSQAINENDEIKFVYTYDVTNAYKAFYNNYNEVNSVRNSLKTAVEEIAELSAIKDAESTQAKVKAINDYIVKIVNYNSDAGADLNTNPSTSAYCNAWTAVGAYVNGTVTPTSGSTNGKIVCEGYAKAFKLVCDNVGIPCILVSGEAFNDPSNPLQKGPHMWNYVKMDDAWYLVDVTWNDANNNETSTDEYLLVGSDESADHVPGNSLGISLATYTPEFTFPTLSGSKYVAPTQAELNEAAVSAAKTTVEAATFAAMQADVGTEEAAKTAVENKLSSLSLGEGISTVVTKVSYTGAVAGTKESASGTNGSYSFTVALTKGSGADQATVTTTTLTMPITATAYVETEKDRNEAAVSAAKTTVKNATFAATQATAVNETAAKTVVEGIVNGLSLGEGVTATVTTKDFTAAIAGTSGNVAGTNGSYKFTVTVKKGTGADEATATTEELTMPITATAYAETEKDRNEVAVSAAKTTVKNATFAATQATAVNETAAKTVVEGIVNGLSLGEGVTATVTTKDFTAAIAGTSGNVAGTNGSYKFTVTVKKGTGADEATATTEELTMPITATAYVQSEQEKNQAIVNTAKQQVEAATYTTTLGQAQTEIAAKEAVNDILSGLSLATNVDVIGVEFTGAVAGTKENTKGTDGSYTFKVALSKGSGVDQVNMFTEVLTLKIVTTAYTATEKDKNEADVYSAKSLVEGMTFTATQTKASTEAAAKQFIEDKLKGMNLGKDINVSVSHIAFVAAQAGTKDNTKGTEGSYTFKVVISKGTGANEVSDMTREIKMQISATQYAAPSSSSSSSSSSPSSSSSSKSTNSTSNKETEPAKIEKTDTSNLIKAEGNQSVKISNDQVSELVAENKPIIIKNDKVEVKMSNKVLDQVLQQSAERKEVSVKLETMTQEKVTAIEEKLTKDGQFTAVNSSNAWISLQTKAASTTSTNTLSQSIAASFKEPVVLTVKLDNVKNVPANKLTLVKYVENEKGETKVVKLGGNFDPQTNSFSGYITDDGNYGVMAAKELKQIQLQIGSNESNIDGSSYRSDVAPQIIDNVTVVPIRFIAESLGANVKWDSIKKQAVITLDGKTVVVGKEEGSINLNGRILVPLRYISENLDANVLWIPEGKQIQIVK